LGQAFGKITPWRSESLHTHQTCPGGFGCGFGHLCEMTRTLSHRHSVLLETLNFDSERKMKPWLWRIVNFWQVVFFLLWSLIWQTLAFILRFVCFSQRVPLWMAHHIWAPALLKITGSSIEVQGADKIDFSKPHFFIFNHQSTLDIALTLKVIPVPFHYIAKRSLLYVPVLGWYLWAVGTVLIDRGRTKKAIRTLKRAGELIRNGKNIVAFPEGTRSSDGSILPFKKGAFVVAIEAGVPIIPVTIEGTHRVMPKNTFRIRPEPILVKFGDPISTKELTYEDREQLMNRVRDEIIELNLSLGGVGGEKQPPSS